MSFLFPRYISLTLSSLGDDGDQKTPVCLVVKELLSGRIDRYWDE